MENIIPLAAGSLSFSLGPVVALVAGILILMMPRLLNYIVALYLIVTGLVQLLHVPWVESKTTAPTRYRFRKGKGPLIAALVKFLFQSGAAERYQILPRLRQL